MFKEKFHPKIKKDIKNLDKQCIKIIQEHLDKIKENPAIYPKLKGNLSFLRSYHFRFKNLECRIVFEIESDTIIYYMISTRENIYKKLSQRIKHDKRRD